MISVLSTRLNRGEYMKKLIGIQFLGEDATYDEINSPVGKLTIITSAKGLHAILWEDDFNNPEKIKKFRKSPNEPIIVKTKTQLAEYFQGNRKIFDLPLVIEGTHFQIQVWDQLTKIPYAKTITYGEQAEKIGDKKKARAVGAANGLNPIPIIVPCHRVIGSNGTLTGFAGGLEKKAFLLKLEQEMLTKL
jgi:methylated-DNA-[protein]-cysteine S-methyltransferase